jgi:hypothetical protein
MSMVGPNTPPDYRYPVTAVNTFLSALRAKDPERLSQATALRAEFEAAEKNRKQLKAIIDKSLPDSDLNDLAKGFEGFTVAGTNQPKSTGRLGVILQKSDGKDMLRRTIEVRNEAKGWKVLDIGGTARIQGYNNMRPVPVKGSGTARKR